MRRRAGEIEDRLRGERAQPPERLVRSILADIDAARPRRRLRSAFRPVALTAAALAGLLFAGGSGYALSVFRLDLGSIFTISKKTSLAVVHNSAAVAQYVAGPSTTPAKPATTASSPVAATTTTTTIQSTTTTSGGSVSAPVDTGTSGSITVTPTGGQQATVAVTWSAQAFTTPVVVQVDPTPPLANTTLLGSGNQLVSVSITSTSGAPLTVLATPLDVTFKNPGPDFVPVISEDGVNFRALTRIPGPPLPDNARDGYYIDSSGNVHILTRHTTIFAVLYKANINVSPGGRKLAPPGSGKFGDPTMTHLGTPPVVSIKGAPTIVGRLVRTTFFVDEQVAAYIRVLDDGKPVALETAGTAFRRHPVGGVRVRTLHRAVLRPGTLHMTLALPKTATGSLSLQLVMVDYDGVKVTTTVPVRR